MSSDRSVTPGVCHPYSLRIRFAGCARIQTMPNPLLTSDIDVFMTVGEINLEILGDLWPEFTCREPEIFSNPRVIWKHMQSRDDFPLRLKTFLAHSFLTSWLPRM